MSERICCVTGDRNIQPQKESYVRRKLQETIENAVSEGFTVFLSSLDQGVDLLFAELVLAQKVRYPHLRLEAVLQYRDCLYREDPLFQQCLSLCEKVNIQREEYRKDCFMECRCFMVARAERLIAVYEGSGRGGMQFTMAYAYVIGKAVTEVCL